MSARDNADAAAVSTANGFETAARSRDGATWRDSLDADGICERLFAT